MAKVSEKEIETAIYAARIKPIKVMSAITECYAGFFTEMANSGKPSLRTVDTLESLAEQLVHTMSEAVPAQLLMSQYAHKHPSEYAAISKRTEQASSQLIKDADAKRALLRDALSRFEKTYDGGDLEINTYLAAAKKACGA